MASLTFAVFVIGGAIDVLTRPAETRRIFAAALTPKRLWVVEGAAHVGLHGYARAGYEQRVGAFLALHLR